MSPNFSSSTLGRLIDPRGNLLDDRRRRSLLGTCAVTVPLASETFPFHLAYKILLLPPYFCCVVHIPVASVLVASPSHYSILQLSIHSMSSSAAAAGGEEAMKSASAIVAEAVRGLHVPKIEGYSRTKGLGNGKFIDSSTFVVGGHRWFIRYYPDGYLRLG